MSDGQILRTGVLFKKGSGAGPFGRKNWKPRYFVLTPARLQYFTFEDGELKGELSLQGCDEGVLEVMPADSMKTGSSASTIWRIAVNAPERRLLVAAGTEMEMNDWVDKLVLAFRINSGQPLQRASMPAPSSMDGVASNPSIKDFQNFSVPRRGLNTRHSTGADMRPSEEQAQSRKAEEGRQLQRAEQEREREQQLQEEAANDAALAAAEELQRQEQKHKQEERERREQRQAGEFQQQQAEELQQQQAEELQQQQQQAVELQRQREQQQAEELQRAREAQEAVERQREAEEAARLQHEAEEAARLQHEQEQEARHSQRLAQELAMQQTLKAQQGEDLLELQRRQKREEHARQRAEREEAIKAQQQQQQQQQDQEDLAFRMTQQMNSHFSVDDESDDSDHEPEGSPMTGASSSPVVNSGPIGSGGLDGEDAARLSASVAAPATAPRSSLVGDVKREMIQKQQLEHQRRREAALKQEQQARQQAEMEQRAKAAPREVEVAPREIEVVRRAPVKKPVAAPMESFEF